MTLWKKRQCTVCWGNYISWLAVQVPKANCTRHVKIYKYIRARISFLLASDGKVIWIINKIRDRGCLRADKLSANISNLSFLRAPPSDWWSCLIGLLTLFSFMPRLKALTAGMQIYGFLYIKIAVIEFREWSRRYTRRRQRSNAAIGISWNYFWLAFFLNLIDAWGLFLLLNWCVFWRKTMSTSIINF